MIKEKKRVPKSDDVSLEGINGTIKIPKNASFWKKLTLYSGPGALVAVGYMDPGNWITSIAGGAEYKYSLLTVILLSSLIAMLLQSMAAKLGMVTGKDLAQMTRAKTNKSLGFALWVVNEMAIMATDIAEVIGGAIALQLLFGLPLLIGVLVTTFDVLLLLLLTRLGFRKIEAIVAALITVIFCVFAYEVAIADPNWGEVLEGFVPTVKIATDRSMLILALGIVGATVMPHNLYLHSSISQSRDFDRTDEKEMAEAVRFTTWDSNIQLSVAFIINCLLLILGGALFYGSNSDLGKFVDLYDALKNPTIVGDIASPLLSTLFAVALLASGQNSTITGTLSGQIVMEGFIRLKIPLWMRRIVTRLLAIIPVIICVILYGGNESAVENLLLYTQVFLSVALPISIIPLTLFTSDKKLMGNFVNPRWEKYLAWMITLILTILNLFLIYSTITVVN
ncbi:Nramp family divalent metal transporter [Enterococcus sp. AZ109]|uniref:Nramp family divalent metal transporter n=1 Tax=Enterococcus sp. AZ109 TaxID=2774634 RepID=UPI003F263511